MSVYRSASPIRLDVHAQAIKTAVCFVTQDVNAYLLQFEIMDGPTAYDLTNKTVEIACKRPDNQIIVDDVDVIIALNGICEYVVQSSIYAIPGEIQAELHIFDGNDRLSTCIFTLQARQGIDN